MTGQPEEPAVESPGVDDFYQLIKPQLCGLLDLLRIGGVRDATYTGMLPAEHVYSLAAMAKRHGFALADYKRHATIGKRGRQLGV